jgi:hypothetical protein
MKRVANREVSHRLIGIVIDATREWVRGVDCAAIIRERARMRMAIKSLR